MTKQINMMYSTISEAFKNGNGDVFFTKDGKFACFSRHDETADIAERFGFTRLTYSEVVKLATEQMTSIEPAPVAEQKAKPKTFIHLSIGGLFNGYYDEFPDAYGQNL